MESISYQDKFWAQIKPYLISFSYEGLPKGVHFTIAFNENSDYVNLHLSKNTVNDDKPKIEICRILKSDLNDLVPFLSISVLNSILTEIDTLDEKFKKSIFIPFEELEKFSKETGLDQNLVNDLKEAYSIKRKKRLKIKNNLEEELDKAIGNEKIQDSIYTFFENLKSQINPDTTQVLVVGEEGPISALLKIKNTWYQMNLNVSLNEIFTKILGEELLKSLVDYTKHSIETIKDLNTYEESKPYNNSIQLYKIEQKQ